MVELISGVIGTVFTLVGAFFLIGAFVNLYRDLEDTSSNRPSYLTKPQGPDIFIGVVLWLFVAVICLTIGILILMHLHGATRLH